MILPYSNICIDAPALTVISINKTPIIQGSLKSVSELKKMAHEIGKKIADGDDSPELRGKLLILNFILSKDNHEKSQE